MGPDSTSSQDNPPYMAKICTQGMYSLGFGIYSQELEGHV